MGVLVASLTTIKLHTPVGCRITLIINRPTCRMQITDALTLMHATSPGFCTPLECSIAAHRLQPIPHLPGPKDAGLAVNHRTVFRRPCTVMTSVPGLTAQPDQPLMA